LALVAAAALAVASPDLFFASFVLADPLAYPLVLTTLYVAVCALSRPSRGTQIAFVVLAALTALTRIQYALLPIVFVAGAIVVERGSLRRAASARPPRSTPSATGASIQLATVAWSAAARHCMPRC
jgi:hypothetical protein